MTPGPEVVLDFWFGHGADDAAVAKAQGELWFGGKPETDRLIRERFVGLRRDAVAGRLAAWESTPHGRLALIVLVDQFSRNIYRGDPEAFRHDGLARRWALDGIAAGHDAALRPIERVFFYLPLQHSENRDDQQRSVALYEALARAAPPAARDAFRGYLDYARRHRDIVERFGRFPHRNGILGRSSTPEERTFLQQPGSAF